MKSKTRAASATAIAATFVAATLALGAVPANAGIQLWDDVNYNGYLGDFGTGTAWVGSTANDRASSLQVTSPATYAILYEDIDYGGRSTGRFYYGSPDLTSWDFNDITSSIG